MPVDDGGAANLILWILCRVETGDRRQEKTGEEKRDPERDRERQRETEQRQYGEPIQIDRQYCQISSLHILPLGYVVFNSPKKSPLLVHTASDMLRVGLRPGKVTKDASQCHRDSIWYNT